MFNIGPLEFMVLAIVGLIVLGPDRIPDLARDAARMLRTLREMATGARTQLREELGPEFADMDLSVLNPRTALQRAILGDEDLKSFDPRSVLKGGLGVSEADTEATVSMSKPAQPPAPRIGPAPFDSDAT